MTKNLLPVLAILIGLTALSTARPADPTAHAQPPHPQPIRGLVLPHHDFARPIIHSSLDRLSGQSYSTLVILSPNHFRPQSYSFTTAASVLNLPISQSAVRQVISQFPRTVVDSQLVSQDHGFTIPANYLHPRFPHAQILPLLFSPYFSPTDLETLATMLSTHLPPDTLYVAAIDFSHNHIWPVAKDYNAQSIRAISTFDYPTILNFTDDHLDSPPAMVTFLRIMNHLGTTSWETWHDTHGAILSNRPTLNGTSYVIGVFR